MKMADAESIRRVSEQVVRKAAGEGNAVIVGPRLGLLPARSARLLPRFHLRAV